MPLYFCFCDRRTSSSVKKKNTIFQLDYNYLNKLTGSQVEEFVIEGCVFLEENFQYICTISSEKRQAPPGFTPHLMQHCLT